MNTSFTSDQMTLFGLIMAAVSAFSLIFLSLKHNSTLFFVATLIGGFIWMAAGQVTRHLEGKSPEKKDPPESP